MALNGKFELVRNEGLLEHLTANGLPEERAKHILEGTKTIEISIDGKNISITRGNGHVQNLTLNQENTEAGPEGLVIKSTPALNGNALTIVSKGDKGEWKRTFSISGSELTVISSSSKPGVPDGKRIFKKI